MVWTNGPLTVFHGTDDVSASRIRASGIDPRLFRHKTDFGAGFYVTTVLHQAEQWANQRCRRTSGSARAEVLQYEVGVPSTTSEILLTSRPDMPQVDPKALDYSDAMKAYFQERHDILVHRFEKSPEEARELLNRYFAVDVSPLERAFLMHTDAETVAADLATAG